MRKFIKIIGSLLVVLVVLVIALAIAVPLLFDINDQKGRIAEAVEDATGRALTIDGDLELTVFPWLGVKTGPMSLTQASGFDPGIAFAAFQAADVRVKLVPLILRREVQVGRITLQGLNIHLERNADGRDNWSDLLDDAPATDATQRPRSDRDGIKLADIEVEGVALSDARIAFRDAQAGASYTVENLNLRTGALLVGAPVEVSLDARVSSGVPQWRGTVAFDGRVNFDQVAKQADLMIERATAELEGGALPVATLRVSLSGQARGNLDSQVWQVSGLGLDMVARGGRIPDRDFSARMSGTIAADLSAQTATLSDFRFEGFGVRATLSAQGSSVVDAPSFNGRVSVDAFSPRQVLADLGQTLPAAKDPTSLTHLQFASQFVATKSSVALSGMEARLDASQLTGRLAVSDFATQALRFDLALDQIDLDRYLPPDTPETEDVPAGALDAVRIPDALIRGLDVDGSARIGRLRAFGLSSEDVQMTVKAQNGLLRVNPATARLYGGGYQGDISMDVRGDVPRVAIHERLVGVQSGAFFGDVFGQSRITGVADMSAQLTGTGETIGAIRPTLDGRIAFSFRDGAVKGVDVWHLIRDARAVFRREERPVAPEGEPQTRFGSLVGTGIVRRGVMTNDDFRAQLPFMNVAGAGTINLVASSLDYRLRVTVQSTSGVDAVAEQEVTELRGKTIPFLISGPFDELSYRVDIADILREEVRDRVEQRLLDELRRRVR